VTPLARRLIAQNGLNFGALAADAKQRGRERIEERDVRAALDLRQATPAPGPVAASPTAATAPSPSFATAPNKDDVVALSAMRLRTAKRLAENWRTIAYVLQAIEVDFTTHDVARQKAKGCVQESAGLLASISSVHRARPLSGVPSVSADQRTVHVNFVGPVA
jgi:pyruvate/2-oxoglutarate dehydrogenase complex dihydrolipoamide acyltransferase (E2) component